MKNFWTWFTNNQQNFKNKQTRKQAHIEFEKQISNFVPEIDFIIIYSIPKSLNEYGQGERIELIFILNGNPKLTKIITDLINNSLKINNFKFTTFTESKTEIDNLMATLQEPYLLQELIMTNSNLNFLPIQYNAQKPTTDIEIFYKNHHIFCNTKTLNQAVYFITQNLIGNNFAIQNTSFVQLAQMPKNQKTIYLYEFQLYIDGYK